MKRLIYGGTLYDGTGSAPVRADVLITDGVISAIGTNLAADGAERVDATGRAVAPGFVDMHRHCDIAPFREERFGELETAQGITSTAVGNCGIACVPISPAHAREYAAFVAPILGELAPEYRFADYAAYARRLDEARLPINMGFLAGTGAVRVAVKGFASTPYTGPEMQRAQAYLAEAMTQGALGVSLGFMYQPECYTTPEEQVRLIRPAAMADGVLTTHIRGEGNSLVGSVKEVMDIANRAGIRLHISHFKATGIKNWRSAIFRAIECIEAARSRGQAVTVDFYPYAGGSTTLFSLIPPCVLREDNAQTLKYLATPQGKAALRRAIAVETPEWDNMALSIGWNRIIIAGTTLPEHAAYSGRDVASLSREQGYEDPSDFICDLLVEENGEVGIIVMSMDERDVDEIARLPYAAVISDALYGPSANPHPRLYGAFPHLIRDFALRRGVIPLEQAIHKLTGLPARYLGLRGRGILTPGGRADLTVFDPAALRDHAVYTDSRRLSTGMDRVIVNGQDVVRGGVFLNSGAGVRLRKQEQENQ